MQQRLARFVIFGLGLAAGCSRDEPQARGPEARGRVAGVERRVTRIVAEQLGVERKDVQRGTLLEDDLKADDLDRVELVMELEETFGITIEDDEIASVQSVGHLIDLVAGKVAHASSDPPKVSAPTGARLAWPGEQH